jgi:MFS family permease
MQGIGVGGLNAGALALIGSLIPPGERGRYQGTPSTVMAVGTSSTTTRLHEHL